MAGIHFSFQDFVPLVRHHTGILDRFDREHESRFSILFFPMKDMLPDAVTRALEKVLRESDAVFAHEDGYYLLLPYTDTEGALHVLNALREYFGQELDEVIITYRDDGTDPTILLKKLHDYAKAWCKTELAFPGFAL